MEGAREEEEGSCHTLVAPDEHTKRQWVTTITKTISSLDRTDQVKTHPVPATTLPASPLKVNRKTYLVLYTDPDPI